MTKRNHFKNTSRKSYHSRSQSNPYFRKKRNIPLKPLLAALGCLIFVVAGSIFLLSSNQFKIHQIDISGVEHIDVSELEQVVSKYLDSHALLFW